MTKMLSDCNMTVLVGIFDCRRYGPREMVVEVRMATSFISSEQAKSNLDKEVPLSKSFESLKVEAAEEWRR